MAVKQNASLVSLSDLWRSSAVSQAPVVLQEGSNKITLPVTEVWEPAAHEGFVSTRKMLKVDTELKLQHEKSLSNCSLVHMQN